MSGPAGPIGNDLSRLPVAASTCQSCASFSFVSTTTQTAPAPIAIATGGAASRNVAGGEPIFEAAPDGAAPTSNEQSSATATAPFTWRPSFSYGSALTLGPGTVPCSLGTGHWAPGTGHRAPGTAHRAPRTAHRAPRTAHRAPRTAHRPIIMLASPPTVTHTAAPA